MVRRPAVASSLLVVALALAAFAPACGTSDSATTTRPTGAGRPDASAGDAATGGDADDDGAAPPDGDPGDAAGSDGGGLLGDGATTDATVTTCDPSAPDQSGCPCTTAGATRACWPGKQNPAARGQGACKDGTQSCAGGGELSVWGDCTGAVTPVAETCANGVDDDCNGLVDCADPTCATDAACASQCNDGDMRPCYDGPAGTVGVGTCRAGSQPCVGGKWSTACVGEVLPTAENCRDTLDHNCNGFRGCDDLFLCLLDSYCWGSCTAPDPMCVCPVGTSDSATCPSGTHGVTKSLGFGTGSPPQVECCPCTSNDCSDPACCAESVCAGAQACGGFTCAPLPASCNDRVDFDCDYEDANNGSGSIAEDCDESCCPCKPNCN